MLTKNEKDVLNKILNENFLWQQDKQFREMVFGAFSDPTPETISENEAYKEGILNIIVNNMKLDLYRCMGKYVGHKALEAEIKERNIRYKEYQKYYRTAYAKHPMLDDKAKAMIVAKSKKLNQYENEVLNCNFVDLYMGCIKTVLTTDYSKVNYFTLLFILIFGRLVDLMMLCILLPMVSAIEITWLIKILFDNIVNVLNIIRKLAKKPFAHNESMMVIVPVATLGVIYGAIPLLKECIYLFYYLKISAGDLALSLSETITLNALEVEKNQVINKKEIPRIVRRQKEIAKKLSGIGYKLTNSEKAVKMAKKEASKVNEKITMDDLEKDLSKYKDTDDFSIVI